MNETVKIDFTDRKSVKNAMKKYGNLDYALCAENQDGEKQMISISADSVVVRTEQHNGWVRVNVYDENGYLTEEYFDDKEG